MTGKSIPVAVVFIVAMFMLVNHFIPGTFIAPYSTHVLNWSLVLAAVAMTLGTVNLLNWNVRNIRRKSSRWYNSVLTLTGLALFAVVGITGGGPSAAFYSKMFNFIMVAFNQAFWGVVLFFIVSAAFRGFVIRNWQATIILLSSLIIMFGQVPIGDALIPGASRLAIWLRDVPNLAGQRGIIIGAAVGAITQQLRVMIGLERGHFGG
jgi:hypothetical protein